MCVAVAEVYNKASSSDTCIEKKLHGGDAWLQRCAQESGAEPVSSLSENPNQL